MFELIQLFAVPGKTGEKFMNKRIFRGNEARRVRHAAEALERVFQRDGKTSGEFGPTNAKSIMVFNDPANPELAAAASLVYERLRTVQGMIA